MSTLFLTPEQWAAVAKSPTPLSVVAPNSKQSYVLISQETYDRIKDVLDVDCSDTSLFGFKDLPDEP